MTKPTHIAFCLFALVFLVTGTTAAAFAAGSSGVPAVSVGADGGHDHRSMPGMDMDDMDMGGDASMHDHGSMTDMHRMPNGEVMPGSEMPGMGGTATAPSDRTRLLVLATFGLTNAGVIVVAAVLRRRKDRRRVLTRRAVIAEELG